MEFFGFTEKEINELTGYYKLEDKKPELLKWYGGYRFGDCNIYNPWSVLNQLKQWTSERDMRRKADGRMQTTVIL